MELYRLRTILLVCNGRETGFLVEVMYQIQDARCLLSVYCQCDVATIDLAQKMFETETPRMTYFACGRGNVQVRYHLLQEQVKIKC